MVWQPPSLTLQQKEHRRLHFAENLQQRGQTISQLAEYYGISASGIYYWKRRFKVGLDGLRTSKPTGRPRRITPSQVEQLRGWLEQPATDHGFSDPTWTASRARDMIGLKFGVWYHPNHVAKLLRFLGFSYQRPDKRAIERNEAKIATWTTIVIPEILRKVQKGATLVFLDESGFSLKTTTCRSWSLRGQTPLIKTRMHWEKLSVIGAVTSTGKFFQHTLQGSFKGPNVARFLLHLLKHLKGDLIVVLDNGSIHKTQEVKKIVEQHCRLTLEFLPPYAPELNPIEQLWALVKTHVLGNRLSTTLSHLRQGLNRAWQRVRRLPLPRLVFSGAWKGMSQVNLDQKDHAAPLDEPSSALQETP